METKETAETVAEQPTRNIVLNLSEKEANDLVQLLDVATKASGLQGAAVALPIVAKLQNAAQLPQ